MNRKQVEEAAEISADLKEAEDALERAKAGKSFKLQMRGDEEVYTWEDIGHCDGVSVDNTGSYGTLAGHLKKAAVDYLDFHRSLIADKLKKLGVEV